MYASLALWFEQRIDIEIKEEDKRYLELLKKWEAERLGMRLEKRRQEEAAEKERKEELERRHAAEWREDREKKFERFRRAKAALEDLVARSSMHNLIVLWFNHVSCSENLLVVCFIYEHYYRVIM